jgi:hypothetical protein
MKIFRTSTRTTQPQPQLQLLLRPQPQPVPQSPQCHRPALSEQEHIALQQFLNLAEPTFKQAPSTHKHSHLKLVGLDGDEAAHGTNAAENYIQQAAEKGGSEVMRQVHVFDRANKHNRYPQRSAPIAAQESSFSPPGTWHLSARHGQTPQHLARQRAHQSRARSQSRSLDHTQVVPLGRRPGKFRTTNRFHALTAPTSTRLFGPQSGKKPQPT